MPELTPEQRAAQDALQAAVEGHVAQYRDGDDGLVTDWALVVCTENFSDDGDRTNAYYLMFAGGSMADHRALGLFVHGQHMLQTGMARRDGDE